MAVYDLIVIGGGPGGYVCAIRAGQLGLSVACVESRETLGGTCLNVGCIPSKALLHASHQYHEAIHNFPKVGIVTDSASIDWDMMLSYKQSTIDANTGGIEFLFKKNKVDWIKGKGEIVEPGKVRVGDQTFETRNIVIATGSEPSSLKGVEVDEKTVVTSTGALELSSIPVELVIIGAGIIGLELGSVYARLGSKVTVLEYLDGITPGMDAEVSKTLQRILKRQGMDFKLGVEVTSVAKKGKANTVEFKIRKTGKMETIKADIVLLSTGRRPYTDGLGLEKLGIGLTKQGQIEVDSIFQTNIKGIYAIGDVTPGPMLAHKAEDEGVAVAEEIAGKKGYVNHDVIPSVIYTQPEVAAVGKTEEQLKEEGVDYKIGKFPFQGNARAKSIFQANGFVKMLADRETDKILGCHIIGPSASDLIQEVCLGLEFGVSAEDIALTCHGHPTYSEAVKEAALACGDGAIHA
ncbi:MAG: dihydrolipoyl dehydrogenase [Rhodobacteraceae bacterium]|nr:dihydrolipoyl dehydrogenase [Paracoccaceae bacterium]MXZ51209.1 dihydrolipoyl dehydrogenase [Paracoccaceae bacterium]MYF47340.1 dihydrolipoyl dehydrogenase [Paracoccaceae bacterium]MYI90344.1 dihydrolipoyl dehydrogenase [Paracoccaceae bacterium]